MKLLGLSLLCLGVSVMTACNGVDPSLEEPESALRERESAIELTPGERMQGSALHGSDIEKVFFASAYHHGRAISNLRIVEGGLVGEVQRAITGTTPSLATCAVAATGQGRSCGMHSKGVGSCRPGTTVTLGGGACGTGSCSGDPIVRVCSGTAACEYGAATMLVSGDDACGNYCPEVSFVCPSTGSYNVLAGAYQSGNAYSVTLVPSTGTFPVIDTLSGDELKDATLSALTEGGASRVLVLSEIINATQVDGNENSNMWDASGKTWLYRLKYRSENGQMMDVCTGDSTLPYAVPVSGLYDAAQGGRSESNTAFSFGCHSGVIAKCYRWGYQPWKDAPGEIRMKYGHAACTRMARADYCGNGDEFTQDGTRIAPWDTLNPQRVIDYPTQADVNMLFEGGWTPEGAKCLNHWRWKNMPANCGVKLVAPQYGPGGELLNRCQPNQTSPCASVCENADDAQNLFGTRVFNKSLITNGP
jgi:hypothetical protein